MTVTKQRVRHYSRMTVTLVWSIGFLFLDRFLQGASFAVYHHVELALGNCSLKA
jgi:hypothetical protein